MAKIRVFYDTNNSKKVKIAHFNFSLMNSNETETQYMDKITPQLPQGDLPYFDDDSANLPDRNSTDRCKWVSNSTNTAVIEDINLTCVHVSTLPNGTFTSSDSKTITISDGIITGID